MTKMKRGIATLTEKCDELVRADLKENGVYVLWVSNVLSYLVAFETGKKHRGHTKPNLDNVCKRTFYNL